MSNDSSQSISGQTGAVRALLAIAAPATTAVFDAAATLEPAGLRALDAIHLATALGVRDDLDGITYENDCQLQNAEQILAYAGECVGQ